ncbi:type II secretion system F family protein [Streptomyces kunmingensis]|uniref:Type II secretion system F family protein n=1 Tax=Streptomyces kunmingensis TaxID=68225 RepID=A0ABU6CDS6_9ACTN|nr:type II secretion system F family protein [Streptomyces kunmingensis]MEB3962861.1 type II secretion system F family protein [Streptomyces kunmingensis]
MTGAVVGVLGVVAVLWAAGRRDAEVRRARRVLGVGPGEEAVSGWWCAVERWWGWARVRPEWGCVVAGSVIGLVGASPLPLVLGFCAVPGAARARRAREARRERERCGDAVIRLCGLMAGEVRAGRQPGEALAVAVRESAVPVGARGAAVVAAARFGGDVSGALREAARQPGAEGLHGLAACWRVAVDRGAGLAAGLERLAGALRAERDQRADLRAQLAGPWSTAVMLAGLPVLGLLLGSALGAQPLRVLLHTGAGVACLVVGGALEAAGMWWAVRIVRGAEG